MTRLVLVCLGVLFFAASAPARPAVEIRKEMAAIRRSTDWGNPAAAKAANEKIKQLAAELAGSGAPPSPSAGADSATEDPSKGGLDAREMGTQIRNQIAEAAGRGKHADILLAKDVREKIVEDFKADVNPTIKNQDVLAEQKTLVIDLSSPAAQAVIDQMESFRSITLLVITGKPTGPPADLEDLLHRAAAYPLSGLYVINLGPRVGSIPASVAQFVHLRELALFGNTITSLPPEAESLAELETLLVDANPIATVLPTVQALPKLTQLGIGKTGVSAAELAEIKRSFPRCDVLTQ